VGRHEAGLGTVVWVNHGEVWVEEWAVGVDVRGQ
jgi:hypothetical protein